MTDWTSRLASAGITGRVEPLDAWRRLRAVEGPSVTLADLYELVARSRGISLAELGVADRHAIGQTAMAELWPRFTVTQGTERPGDLIRLVAYDRTWPDRFALWRRQISDALGSRAERIEHVGSTSVPGLAAKPIIDIQVSVGDLADEPGYVPALQQLGLDLRSRDDLHRYFRPVPARPREVHVHVCAAGSIWEDEHLLFRDYLREHAEARSQYLQAKRAAASQWSDDGFAYTDAKTVVVLELLARARHERASRN